MQDKTIDNALLALRKQIIRGDGENLAHVEALLQARDVAMPAVLPGKKPDAARHGQMRRIVLDALRERPRGLQELADHIFTLRPGIGPDAAYHRTSCCLNRMKAAGLVRREGRVWLVAADQTGSNFLRSQS